jgi:hypothetical protein
MWSKYLQACCSVQNQNVCQKVTLKKAWKWPAWKVFFVDKPSIIDNPYIKTESADVQYVGKLRYAKQMFTNLFCSKLRFSSKGGWKICGKMIY